MRLLFDAGVSQERTLRSADYSALGRSSFSERSGSAGPGLRLAGVPLWQGLRRIRSSRHPDPASVRSGASVLRHRDEDLLPSRQISRNTASPAATRCSSRVTWLTLVTVWWLTSRITSFGGKPGVAGRAVALDVADDRAARIRAADLELGARHPGVIASSLHAEAGRGRRRLAVRLAAAPRLRPCSASRSSSSTVMFSALRCLSR